MIRPLLRQRLAVTAVIAIILSLVVSITSRANSSSPDLGFWAGEWSGTVRQPNYNPESYQVLIHIKPVWAVPVGDSEYPDLNCRGELGLISATSSGLKLKETITQNPAKCSSGTMVLVPGGADTAAWRWYGLDGREYVSGTVRRTRWTPVRPACGGDIYQENGYNGKTFATWYDRSWTADNDPRDEEYVFYFYPRWAAPIGSMRVYSSVPEINSIIRYRWRGHMLSTHACASPVTLVVDKLAGDLLPGGVNYWKNNLWLWHK